MWVPDELLTAEPSVLFKKTKLPTMQDSNVHKEHTDLEELEKILPYNYGYNHNKRERQRPMFVYGDAWESIPPIPKHHNVFQWKRPLTLGMF